MCVFVPLPRDYLDIPTPDIGAAHCKIYHAIIQRRKCIQQQYHRIIATIKWTYTSIFWCSSKKLNVSGTRLMVQLKTVCTEHWIRFVFWDCSLSSERRTNKLAVAYLPRARKSICLYSCTRQCLNTQCFDTLEVQTCFVCGGAFDTESKEKTVTKVHFLPKTERFGGSIAF